MVVSNWSELCTPQDIWLEWFSLSLFAGGEAICTCWGEGKDQRTSNMLYHTAAVHPTKYLSSCWGRADLLEDRKSFCWTWQEVEPYTWKETLMDSSEGTQWCPFQNRGKAELDLWLEKSGLRRHQMASWHFYASAIAQKEREKPPHPAAWEWNSGPVRNECMSVRNW